MLISRIKMKYQKRSTTYADVSSCLSSLVLEWIKEKMDRKTYNTVTITTGDHVHFPSFFLFIFGLDSLQPNRTEEDPAVRNAGVCSLICHIYFSEIALFDICYLFKYIFCYRTGSLSQLRIKWKMLFINFLTRNYI